jgi:hypothetical protein
MPIDFDEIYPKIFVYKSRLEDVCKIQKLTEELHSIWESEGLTTPFWTKWYEFGEKVDTDCNFFNGSELFNTKKAELENLIDSVFDEFTSHYVDFFNKVQTMQWFIIRTFSKKEKMLEAKSPLLHVTCI